MTFIKIMSAVVIAVAVAYTSGFVADQTVHSEELSENAVAIEIAAADVPTPAKEIVVAVAEEATSVVPETVEAVSDISAEIPVVVPEAFSLTAAIAAADTTKGKKLSRACAACHKFDKGGKNITGPALWGVVGREKSSVEGFKYSTALQELEGAWTYEDLDAYLTKPKAFAPGTKMTYGGMKKPADRAAFLAWLREQADEPVALDE